jgi:hypothetical protein
MKFYTLGPTGSCHENALKAYLEFQGVTNAEIVLGDDLVQAAEAAVLEEDAYVLQCSAHLNVHVVTERFLGRLHVVDTFILPTKPIALVKRRDVENPKRLGLPEPTLGYINPSDWDELVLETTKPVVEKNLLQGKYDAGIAYVSSAEEHPEHIEIMKAIGEVVTTWIVYGRRKRYAGQIIAMPYPELISAS